MAGLLLGASFPAGALPAEGDFDIHVDWVSNYTTYPVTEVCAYGGTVAAGLICPEVRVRFNRLQYQGFVWVTSMTIHEVAGHTEDTTTSGGMDVNQRKEACGDPDPEDAPQMVYFNYRWDGCIGRHNGTYTIKVKTHYLSIPEEELVPGEEREITIDVQNLHVTQTSPANPNVIQWDPEHPDPVSLSVTAACGYTERCDARLQIYSATRQPVRTLVRENLDTVGPGGTTIPIAWDGKDEQGQTCPKGIYFFDWRVATTLVPDSADYDKSTFLSVTPVSYELVQYNYETTDAVVRVNYTLSDTNGQAPTACDIAVYAPDFTLVKTVPAVAALGAQSVDVPCTLDMAGKWGFVVRPVDNGAARDRMHRNRHALQNDPPADQQRVLMLGLVNPDFLPAAAPAVAGDPSPPPPSDPVDAETSSSTTVEVRARVVLAPAGSTPPENAKVDTTYTKPVRFRILTTEVTTSAVRIVDGGVQYGRADYFWTGNPDPDPTRPRSWTVMLDNPALRDKSVSATAGVATAELTSLSFAGRCRVSALGEGIAGEPWIPVPKDTDGDELPDAWEEAVGLDPATKRTGGGTTDDDLRDQDPSGVPGNNNNNHDGMANWWEYVGFFYENGGAMRHRRGNPSRRELRLEIDVMQGSTAEGVTALRDALADVGIDLYWVEDQTGTTLQANLTDLQITAYHVRWGNSAEYNRNGLLVDGQPAADGRRDPAKAYDFVALGYKWVAFADSRAPLAYGVCLGDNVTMMVFDGTLRGLNWPRNGITLSEGIAYVLVHEVGHSLSLRPMEPADSHHNMQRQYPDPPDPENPIPHWDGCVMHTRSGFGTHYSDNNNNEDDDPELNWFTNPRYCAESHDPDDPNQPSCAALTSLW